jgi:hypothetical protein
MGHVVLLRYTQINEHVRLTDAQEATKVPNCTSLKDIPVPQDFHIITAVLSLILLGHS